ncbi:hypothetical protein QQ045_022009 [Rhodiola kirilowii]
MSWANYPCCHLIWCDDCRKHLVEAAASSEHKCVVICNAKVEKMLHNLNSTSWDDSIEPHSLESTDYKELPNSRCWQSEKSSKPNQSATVGIRDDRCEIRKEARPSGAQQPDDRLRAAATGAIRLPPPDPRRSRSRIGLPAPESVDGGVLSVCRVSRRGGGRSDFVFQQRNFA